MRATIFLVLLGLFALPTEAQTIWSRPYEPNQLAIETILPDATGDASPFSGATFFTGTVSITDNLELAAELPVARYDPTTQGLSSTTALGNPYLGLGFNSTSTAILVEVGARIPAAPANKATRIGRTADMGRLPAFRPEEFVLSGLFNTRFSMGRFSSLRLRTGFSYATSPAPSSPDEIDRKLRMQYDAQVWREGNWLITGASLTGRATLTRPGGTQHHAVLSVMGNWTGIQPGLVAGMALNPFFVDNRFAAFGGITLSISYTRLL